MFPGKPVAPATSHGSQGERPTGPVGGSRGGGGGWAALALGSHGLLKMCRLVLGGSLIPLLGGGKHSRWEEVPPPCPMKGPLFCFNRLLTLGCSALIDRVFYGKVRFFSRGSQICVCPNQIQNTLTLARASSGVFKKELLAT